MFIASPMKNFSLNSFQIGMSLKEISKIDTHRGIEFLKVLPIAERHPTLENASHLLVLGFGLSQTSFMRVDSATK
jgi:hypothetical protein